MSLTTNWLELNKITPPPKKELANMNMVSCWMNEVKQNDYQASLIDKFQ